VLDFYGEKKSNPPKKEAFEGVIRPWQIHNENYSSSVLTFHKSSKSVMQQRSRKKIPVGAKFSMGFNQSSRMMPNQ